MGQLPELEKKALNNRNTAVRLYTPEFQRQYGVKGLKVEAVGNRGLDRIHIYLNHSIYDIKGLEEKLNAARFHPKPSRSKFVNEMRLTNASRAFDLMAPVKLQRLAYGDHYYGSARTSPAYVKVGKKSYFLASAAQEVRNIYDKSATTMSMANFVDADNLTKVANPYSTKASISHNAFPDAEFHTTITINKPLQNKAETLRLLKLFLEGKHIKLD